MTRLTVAIRVRPLSDREISAKSVSIVSVENGRTIAVTNIKVPEQNAGDSRERVRRFNFDYCFDYTATQQDVFKNISAEIIKSLQKRFHSCVLTYGQSASGKTHTMIGCGQGDEAGLVPRLCRNIFRFIADCAVGSEIGNLNATVSYLEIYNERVRDLLDTNHENVTLKVREHPKNGPYVQGLSERTVDNCESLLDAFNFGNSNRTVGSTNANPQSSRSHSVFTITCLDGLKLRFIDLAGSERAGSHTTTRFREGSNINKSLVALRNVISALAEWSKYPKLRKRFVPYRDSILTWLLKDTLGGNSKIVLVSTVSPSSTCYNETVNTLRFGQRAKQIVVQPLVNEDPKERTIRELRAEIAKLKELLLQTQVPSKCYEIENSSDSDSGLSENPIISSDSYDSDTVESKVNFNNCENFKQIVQVDKLIPVMEVVSNVKKIPDDSIANSVETIEKEEPTSISSPEGSQSGRKKSADKPHSSKLKKMESKLKIETKAKVDSHRKGVQPKPRSQIVAAVTQRLYNKVKRKEVATDTLDLNSPTRDLSITSKARLRLQELTHRALSAHRRKNVETQTSLFPVLRIKEASTDVDDLRLASEQIAHVTVGTDAIELRDSSTNCSFLDTLIKLDTKCLVFTRTCSTSTENLSRPDEKPNISFTKYLLPNDEAAKLEITSSSNPIYASSVNINVNHNYNSMHPCTLHTAKVNDNVSDDSLEENANNVCFPTPDLISNHNSLEQHAQASTASELRYATSDSVEEIIENQLDSMASNNICVANCSISEQKCSHKPHFNLEMQYAPQTCVTDKFDEDYELFYKAPPHKYRPKVSEDTLNDPLMPREPVVLKSIMKCDSDTDDSSDYMINTFDDVPDSLNYYYEKSRKKVRFDSPEPVCHHKLGEDRMFNAMTNFMKEVTTLMTNLTKVANKLDQHEQTYDVQVTVNDVQGIELNAQCADSRRFTEEFSQTSRVNTNDAAVEVGDEDFPINKYQHLVEMSCDRLERTVKKTANLHKFPQPFSVSSVSDWNYQHNNPEYSSLDSQRTFSDYGSLPRKHGRMSFGSPSTYLRQLTSMRREIVKNTREELLNEAAQIHL